MAKRGQFFPYRVIFRYPNGVNSRNPHYNIDMVLIEAARLLRRGADVDIAEVDPATRKTTILRTITAEQAEEIFPQLDDDGDTYGQRPDYEILAAWMKAHPVVDPRTTG